MRSANPALNKGTFRDQRLAGGETMSLQGTVNKTAILLLLTIGTAGWTWTRFFEQGSGSVSLWMAVGGIGGLIVAIATVFKKTWSPLTAPLYAGLEGLALGGISAYFESRFPGIAMQAVSLTFGTLLGLLLAYKSGWIKVTENFRLGVFAATFAIMGVYLCNIVLGFFGIRLPFIHEGGTFGILFSAFVVIVAAMNLVLDFDFIESGADSGAPKYMEWYGAFGLLVTLVWLYIEILHLLAKLRSRR